MQSTATEQYGNTVTDPIWADVAARQDARIAGHR